MTDTGLAHRGAGSTEYTRDLADHVRARWTPPAPLHLGQTLGVLGRGREDPTLRVLGPDCVWVTTRHQGLAVTARFARATDTGTGTPDRPGGDLPHDTAGSTEPSEGQTRLLRDVVVDAWGPGAASWLPTARRWCGGADDWRPFESSSSFAQLPHLLRRARHAHPGLCLPATAAVLERTVMAVLEQRVTVIEAIRAYRFLLARFGENPPGPAPRGMRVPPTAAQWRHVPSWTWHRAGVDPARSATVMRVVHRAPALERLAAHADPVTVRTGLQSIPGVGPWTAAEVTQCTHADPDGISVFDYHLADHVCWFFDGAPGPDQRMLELLEPWRGNRQRVVRLLTASGYRKPSFGPRFSPADHRSH